MGYNRKPTAEQQEAAAEKRRKFAELVSQVAAMTDDQRAELAARIAVTTCDGHPVSPFNANLIARQFEGATVIGGFKQWLNAGRCVRKGQHGFGIYAPRLKGEGDDKHAEGFIMVTMFDISQTEPLPEAAPAA